MKRLVPVVTADELRCNLSNRIDAAVDMVIFEILLLATYVRYTSHYIVIEFEKAQEKILIQLAGGTILVSLSKI